MYNGAGRHITEVAGHGGIVVPKGMMIRRWIFD